MPPAERDQNRVPVLMGVSADDGVTPIPIRINPVTGEVLGMYYAIVHTPTPPTRVTASRDDNHVPVKQAARTDDDEPMMVSVRSGRLLVDAI